MSAETIVTYARTMLRTFDDVPFNNVDAAILSQLAYAQLDGEQVPSLVHTRAEYQARYKKKYGSPAGKILRAVTAGLTKKKSSPLLHDEERFVSLYTALWRAEDFENIFPSLSTREMMIELVSAVVASPRFRDIKVGEFTYEFNNDREHQQQFAAMTFLLPETAYDSNDSKTTEFIAFRGTETSFVGWREDFELAFHKDIPSQLSAARYVEDIYRHSHGRNLVIAGHSKGGNTAVYAATKVPANVQNAIQQIYSFDGPGFITNLLDSPEYKRIEPKLTKLIPQDSFVGMMFAGREPYRVVHSDEASVMQHFMYKWAVDLDSADFVYDQEISSRALKIANSYVEWTNSLDLATRRKVIDAIFAIFEATGYESFTEIADNISTAAPMMWQAAQETDSAVRDITVTALRDLFSMIFGFNNFSKYTTQWEAMVAKVSQSLPFSKNAEEIEQN